MTIAVQSGRRPWRIWGTVGRQFRVGAAPLAPATVEPPATLRDPAKRPQTRQVPLPGWLADYVGPAPLAVDPAKLRANLQSARWGAAAGPSGLVRVRDLLVIAAQRLAQADVPDDVAAGLRLGRMVALLKPSGGIRALVMGDVFRRLVSRTLAQQFSTPLQEACAPYQYALSTRAGAEALERALRVATDMSTSTTVVSVDGVGAYDHISRKCMFDGLLASPALVPLVPLVRLFYGGDSEYLFYDASGAAHAVLQSEGGEQGAEAFRSEPRAGCIVPNVSTALHA
ncbi:unnamed protein product, partial [Symbiodinium pilosum]